MLYDGNAGHGKQLTSLHLILVSGSTRGRVDRALLPSQGERSWNTGLVTESNPPKEDCLLHKTFTPPSYLGYKTSNIL